MRKEKTSKSLIAAKRLENLAATVWVMTYIRKKVFL